MVVFFLSKMMQNLKLLEIILTRIKVDKHQTGPSEAFDADLRLFLTVHNFNSSLKLACLNVTAHHYIFVLTVVS